MDALSSPTKSNMLRAQDPRKCGQQLPPFSSVPPYPNKPPPPLPPRPDPPKSWVTTTFVEYPPYVVVPSLSVPLYVPIMPVLQYCSSPALHWVHCAAGGGGGSG